MKYSYAGISVLPANLLEDTVDNEAKLKKLTYTYTKEGVEVKGDIPAIIWEEDFDGSRSMNAKAKNKYLYDVLMANVSETNQTSTATPSAPKPLPTASPAQAFPELKESVNTDMQELPF